MSIESVMSRIAAIQGALPAAPAPQPTPSTPFATALQGAMAPASGAQAPASVQAAPGTYPHLDGDLDANPELLRRLEALAARRGEHFHINSGLRTLAEQQRLWDNRGSNPYPVARPGTSRHESGRAADVTIGGRDIQSVISAAELRAAGINPLAGDSVHVELP
jgi:D-alanyl-D-alanine carboxypeptidase-like protein